MTTPKPTALIATIAAAMERQGITAIDLANMIGTSRQTLSQYLAGHKQPGALVVQRMLDALALNPAHMLPPRKPRRPIRASKSTVKDA